MKGFLAFAIALMNSLKYPGKFVITGTLTFISVTILLASLAIHLYQDIRLAGHELVATEFMLPLHKQIQLTQQHRGISAAYLAGDSSMRQLLEAKQAEVNAALRTADAMEERHSTLLGGHAEWLTIKSDWKKLTEDVMTMSVAGTLAAHGQLIERILRFQLAIANTGGLNLDSEIDTHYLATTLVKGLPDMLERLGKIRAKGTGILVRKRLTNADRIEFSVHNILLRTTLADLKMDLEKAGHHAPTIEPRLEMFARELGEATALAVGLVETDIIGERFSVTPQVFFDKFTQAIDIGYQEMFTTLLPTLKQQLDARILRLKTYLALQIGIAALFLLVLTYISLGAYYSIVESVRRLSVGARTIAKGDLSARIHLDGSDELTSVGNSFNMMASSLGHLLQQSKQTAEDLAQALAEAQQADQTKDAFLANVSHELRTPLNAVIGFADLARRSGCPPEKQHDYLAKISSAGNTLSSIINDLLDLSKIAAGRMELDPVTFRLSRLLARCRSTMSFKLAEKNLQLIERIDDQVPDVLVGDNLRIEQILLNLLSNAVKFTDLGHIEMRVHLHASEENRVCLSIEVADTGIGMSEEEITRLFQPFSQADASMSRKFGGTGLGLALCWRLAQAMDGDIAVSSRPGNGTTFQVKLWVGLGDAARIAEEAIPAPRQEAQPSYRATRILVVDDQPMNREIATELLSSVGVAVDAAENGEQAIDILVDAGPAAFDAVMMDIQMPVMDGLAATRALRARPEFKDLPIIAMTAHTMEHEKQISSAAGFNDHIGKPFETTSFYRVLAKWIVPEKQEIARKIEDWNKTGDTVAVKRHALNTLPGVDVTAALNRFGGKEERYRHWLADFMATASETPGQIRDDMTAGALDAAAKKVHAFKGRIGMLGMTDLHRTVSALELAVRENTDTDRLLAELDLAIGRMQGELAKILDGGTESQPGGQQALQKLTCSETFSVGIPELDEQHKKLITMVNQLADYQRSCIHPGETGVRTGEADKLHEILSRVFDYTRIHFKTEEDYMEAIGHPQLPAHINEHSAFVEKISAFSVASSSGVLEAVEMHRYLLEWLKGHILGSDMSYARHAGPGTQAAPQGAGLV